MYLGDNQPNRMDQSKAQYACIRTVVVDDEPMARSVLSDGTQFVAPEINIVGQAENGIHAIDQIQTIEPELVFLDVQPPGALFESNPETRAGELVAHRILLTCGSPPQNSVVRGCMAFVWRVGFHSNSIPALRSVR